MSNEYLPITLLYFLSPFTLLFSRWLFFYFLFFTSSYWPCFLFHWENRSIGRKISYTLKTSPANQSVISVWNTVFVSVTLDNLFSTIVSSVIFVLLLLLLLLLPSKGLWALLHHCISPLYWVIPVSKQVYCIFSL